MGSLREGPEDGNGEVDEDEETEETPAELSGETWARGSGEGTWQTRMRTVKERVSFLHNCREMSDLGILANDENWWFGDTVKDFTAHKLVLGSVSPVLHKVLFELDEEGNPDRRLLLDKRFAITLSLVQCYDYVRLDIDGVPPIVVEAMLDYIYKDKFEESDYENGYSRNLLWRLWHASKAFEMDHLINLCTKTLHSTMCEDTVFWDLNYAMQYEELGTADIMTKVLKLSDDMHERLFENPNFVWLEKDAVHELLRRRNQATCEAMVVYNNLLRWCLYQIDRTACAEEGLPAGAVVPIRRRLEWICACRSGEFDHINTQDLDKYLERATRHMPWTELSQKDFVEWVAPWSVLAEQELLRQSLLLMEEVVRRPERLDKSAFQCAQAAAKKLTGSSRSNTATPMKGLSRSNSLRKSVKDVKLRSVVREKKEESMRPVSYVG